MDKESTLAALNVKDRCRGVKYGLVPLSHRSLGRPVDHGLCCLQFLGMAHLWHVCVRVQGWGGGL